MQTFVMSWGAAGLWARPDQAGMLESATSARPHQAARSAAGGRKGAVPRPGLLVLGGVGVEAEDGSTQGHSRWLWGLWLQLWPRPVFWASTVMDGRESQKGESRLCEGWAVWENQFIG